MVKISSRKPVVGPLLAEANPKVVFGFSELKYISFVEAERDGKFFIDYLERLQKLSLLTWNDLYTSNRHSFGTENMPVDSLTKQAKVAVPTGIDRLIVLRATGSNHVFLGYREKNVFQVLFIGYKFGDIYKH